MISWRRARLVLAVALAVAAALWLAWPQSRASAHANYLRSSPGSGGTVDAAPDRVIIWFTEPIEQAFSEIRVLDAAGSRVDNGDSSLDPTEPTALIVTLPALPDGVYTVAWRNVSTVDGHSVRGSFYFSVGDGAPPLADTHSESPLLQSPVDPWQRWLFFVGAVTVVGGLLFEIAVTGPALGAYAAESPQGRVAQKLSDRLTFLVWAGLGLAVLGSLGQLVQQSALTAVESFLGGLNSQLATVMTSTSWGRLWAARTGLLLAAAVLVFLASRSRRPGDEEEAPGLLSESMAAPLALACALGALAMTTLMSHSAAAPPDVRSYAVLNDMVHIVSSAAWVGGLFYLAVSVPVIFRELNGGDRRSAFLEIVPRLTTLAFVAAGTAVVTGLFSAWVHVQAPQAVPSPYGRALMAKAALLAPTLVLAFVNAYVFRPRLEKGAENAPSLIRRAATAEAGLAVLLLMAVGWMASLEPARQYASRTASSEVHTVQESEGARMDITVFPGTLGLNNIMVKLTDRRGEHITNAEMVRGRLVFRGQDLGADWVEGFDHEEGVWIVHGLDLNVVGAWQVEVEVVRPDAFDARAAYAFEVFSGAVNSERFRPDPHLTRVLFWGMFAVIGLVLLAAAAPLRKRAARTALALAAPGAMACLAGIVVAVALLLTGTDAAAEINPVLPTQESVTRGGVVYGETCATCHGSAGRGDGPGGQGLPRKPADLVVHVPLHPDRRLFELIRDGIPASGMPAQRGNFLDEDIWHLVNYLRVLASR